MHIYVSTSFDEINRRLDELVKENDIRAKGYLRLNDISIRQINAYASCPGLAISLKTGKDLEGDFVLTGYPLFDQPEQALKIKNFDFAVDAGSMFVNRGGAMFCAPGFGRSSQQSSISDSIPVSARYQ